MREVIDLSTDDGDLRFELMKNCMFNMSQSFNKNSQPNRVATEVNQYVKQRTGCEDAYYKQKKASSEIALSMIDKVDDILKRNDGLETYVKAAIVGNIIDFGAYDINTDFKALISTNLNRDLTVDDTDELENALKKHDGVLYLADNTGEIVFDRLLIEKIKSYDVSVTVAVKDSAIVNDACKAEALEAGIDELAGIVSVGSDMGGIVEEMFSDEFRRVFDESGFIISKGMANYEGLTEMDLGQKDVFCLLSSKCRPISKDLGVDLNSFVLKKL